MRDLPQPAGAFEIGGVVEGTRYRVVALLGTGGMGSVYEVEHVELGKRFVLKALLRELSGRQDLVLRLRNEQRALGRLEHPNIVTVTDAGVTGSGVPFFVMERLEGETLGARVRRLGRLAVPEALGVAEGVLDALSAAHQLGIIHRDIKPQNVFLIAGCRPKLLDFGVAKMAAAGNVITARGVAVGTPRYMSPEQASGGPVDGRADLYAVGLLLFEALCGRGPFNELRDSNELLLAQLGRPVPPPSSLASGVTRELDELVLGLLAKRPAARPPTARAAAEALRAVARRYRGLAELEDPTPVAAYTETTQRVGLPALAEVALDAGDDAPTLVRRVDGAGTDDTYIDERTPPPQSSALATSSVAAGRPGAGDPTNTCVIAAEPQRGARPVLTRTRAAQPQPAALTELADVRVWRAVGITLAGAGLGVAALSVFAALFPG